MFADQTAHPDWDGFLNRAPLARRELQAASSLQGKRILITGSGGSIGSALTMAIAELSPEQMILLESSERNLYDIDRALNSLPSPVQHASLLGSAGDPALLKAIFGKHRPHVVYHAAAFKHVPLMEQNPFAAIQNNSLATDLLYGAAAQHEAEQLILLSTDKAVDPISIMGASKRIAELILLAPRTATLRTKAVRLGNVLGSEGSIVPLFLQQIAMGTPVTVTHPDIRRYFLTAGDAITLLLEAASSDRGGILVPDLGLPLKVAELARYLIAAQAGERPAIVFTQPRPGDKLCEALLSDREHYRAQGSDDHLLRAVESPSPTSAHLQQTLLELRAACEERSLQRLLMAVASLVPEYRPSALLDPGREPREERS